MPHLPAPESTWLPPQGLPPVCPEVTLRHTRGLVPCFRELWLFSWSQLGWGPAPLNGDTALSWGSVVSVWFCSLTLPEAVLRNYTYLVTLKKQDLEIRILLGEGKFYMNGHNMGSSDQGTCNLSCTLDFESLPSIVGTLPPAPGLWRWVPFTV